VPDTLPWTPTVLAPPPEAPGYVPNDQDDDALPAATRLDEFEIIRVLGAGGFGIVYLALDHVLLRYVAIKEYMPSALANRSEGGAVTVRSGQNAETFALGLESFFNEARMLASFDHPSLVKVHRFWKANGTAYMVMQYYPGQTLKDARRAMQSSPDEAWLLQFVEPILGALAVLHGEGVYHRDIAPDNILLLPDGRPVLLDFGSARRVIGDRTQSLTAILKPNFAPVEQYADDPGMRQGPWTDLYALGATIHFILTGQVPIPAVMRAVRDSMPTVSGPDAPPYAGVGADFLATIDWALALAPEDRPQSVATFEQAIRGEVHPPAIAPRKARADEGPAAFEKTYALAREKVKRDIQTPSMVAPPQAAKSHSGFAGWRMGAMAAAFAAVCALGWFAFGMRDSNSQNQAVAAAKTTATTTPSTISSVAVSSAKATPVTETAPASKSAEVVPSVVRATPAVSEASPTPSVAAAPAKTATLTSTPTATTTQAPSAKSPREPTLANVARERMERARPDQARNPSTSSNAKPPPSPVAPATAAQPAQMLAANSRSEARSPRERCGDLNFLAMAICVSRRCQEPAYQAHPQCDDAKRFEEQRRRRVDQ
jgi:serine/threonine protein kinase